MKVLNKASLWFFVDLKYLIKFIAIISFIYSLPSLSSDDFSFNKDENREVVDPKTDSHSEGFYAIARAREDRLQKKNIGFQKKNESSSLDKEKSKKDIVLTGPLENKEQALVTNPIINEQPREFNKNQQSANILDDAFRQDLEKNLNVQKSSSKKSDIDLVVTDQDRVEIKNLIDNQLQNKLLNSQIKIIEQVTDSYLNQVFKNILKRSVKRFIKNVIIMIFKEIRSAQKKNNFLTNYEISVISKKIYEKELSQKAINKKHYIQTKTHSQK